MRRVAIIGSGPAGLVAAKAMVSHGFLPTIYERSQTIGGMWNPNNSSNSAWGDDMRTNVSKFTCNFSDLSWEHTTPSYSSSSLSNTSCAFSSSSKPTSASGVDNFHDNIFPTKEQIYQYLLSYYQKFLASIPIKYNCDVVEINDDPSAPNSWCIKWKNVQEDDTIHSEIYDYVVVATGFFHESYYPRHLVSNQYQGDVTHSSQYDFLKNYEGKVVAVIGGSHNAAEIASNVAFSAKTVYHISPRSFWPVPRFLPSEGQLSPSPYLPLDLIFYQRPHDSTFENEVYINPPEKNNMLHNYFRSFHGDSQYAPNKESNLLPPFIAISDFYSQMHQSNKIHTIFGKVNCIDENGNIFASANGGVPLCSNIDSVIFCTGYKTRFPFFSSRILNILQYNSEEQFMPLVLHRNMIHPDLPQLGFVGMYRGPFFGVMEKQAVSDRHFLSIHRT